jgi:gentisate 1,2-dioxygenase
MSANPAIQPKPNFDHMLEYWLGDYRPKEPTPAKSGLPFLWRWEDLRSVIYPTRKSINRLVSRNDDLASNEAERRGFALVNPTLFGGPPYMTNTLYSDIQLLTPGERCTAHRHTSSASRFIMEGNGGYTVIDGERIDFGPGDLVIAPNWTWHHHGNETDNDIIYLNILDIPMATILGSIFNDLDYKKVGDKEADYQSVKEPLQRSQTLYGAGGIVPKFLDLATRRKTFTSQYHYPWKQTQEHLEQMKKYEGSPYDGILVEYVNPQTGGPVIPTMSFNMQLLRPSEHTSSHRQTSSAIYVVHGGRGYTLAGDKRIDWEKNDVFAIPPWVWHEHVNLQSNSDATLLTVTDQPVVRALGFYKEEGRDKSGNVKLIEQVY